MKFVPNIPSLGINPRELLPNHAWQIDVTHISSFGRLQFVHVSIDTCSHMIHASAHSGEKLKDVKAHCLQAFAYMGVPKQIKTNNGPIPAKASKNFVKIIIELIKQAFLITLKAKPLLSVPIAPLKFI